MKKNIYGDSKQMTHSSFSSNAIAFSAPGEEQHSHLNLFNPAKLSVKVNRKL